MNRTEFIIATAIILLVAFTVGYFASWLVQRFSRVSTAEVATALSPFTHRMNATRQSSENYVKSPLARKSTAA